MIKYFIYAAVLLGAFSIYLLFTQPQNFFYYAERIITVLFKIIIAIFKLIFKFFEGIINLFTKKRH